MIRRERREGGKEGRTRNVKTEIGKEGRREGKRREELRKCRREERRENGRDGEREEGGKKKSERRSKVAQEAPFLLTRDVLKAVHAIKFVAAHLKNEDDFSEVGGLWWCWRMLEGVGGCWRVLGEVGACWENGKMLEKLKDVVVGES